MGAACLGIDQTSEAPGVAEQVEGHARLAQAADRDGDSAPAIGPAPKAARHDAG
jgi:hypothetical protein